MMDEAELRRMSPEERRRLARALAAFDEPRMLRDPRLERRRRLALLVFMGCCVFLAGWIVVLEFTLPKHYTTHDWRGAWVGFDIAEFAAFAVTGWAAWRERQILILCLAVTGTLLWCDAWFDIVLDLGTREFLLSVVSAACAELPLTFMMFAAAWRLVRMSVGVVMALEGVDRPVPSLWRIPLFAEGLEGTLPARYRSRGKPAPGRRPASLPRGKPAERGRPGSREP
ncbi:MAG TPA: hypothetical protein VKV80_06670 [Streptosporangiaceae bacterium]|nr:hypothetical protein [Streptosporangiaceae bacterium]